MFFSYMPLFFFFLPYHAAGGVLVPQPGIKPKSPALEAWSLLDHCWTTEEVSVCAIFDFSYWRPLESSG